jgi:hypothetical protein
MPQVDAGPVPDAPPPSSLPTCSEQPGDPMHMVARLSFVRADSRGISRGLNIDGRVSPGTDPANCLHENMVSPDGEEGIDNQFATLLPALEAVGGDAIEGLMQAAVYEGDLLLGIEILGLDDPFDDACVQVRISRGSGVPILGADGTLLAGQTYARKTDGAVVVLDQVRIQDGMLEAGPFELDLPVKILDREIRVRLLNTRIRLFTGPVREGWTGLVAGAIQLDEIYALALEARPDPISYLIENIVGEAADQLPDEDGVCQGLSATLQIETRPGFY